MNLPNISDIKILNIGNSIVQITSGWGFKSNTLANLTKLFKGDACQLFSSDEEEYSLCNSFYNGILTEGIEQTLIKMISVIGEIIEELNSVNNGGRAFNDIIKSSSFISYELFIEFYYQKAYRFIDEIFWKLRNEKIKSIFQIFEIILTAYVIISLILFLFMFYFIWGQKTIISSFLNFIWIIPSKYFSEDKYFFEEIVRINNDYF